MRISISVLALSLGFCLNVFAAEAVSLNDDDCRKRIDAGMAMVAAGTAQLPNPPTAPAGQALIAAGMSVIAAGMACEHTEDPKPSCNRMIEAGNKMINEGKKLSKKAPTKASGEALLQAGKKLVQDGKECRVIKKLNSQTLTKTATKTATSLSTAVTTSSQVTTVTHTMSNGREITATVTMVQITPSQATAISMSLNTSTSTNTNLVNVLTPRTKGETIDAMVGIGYENEADCAKKLDRLNSIKGASVQIPEEEDNYARYCGAFDYEVFPEDQKMREDRLLYKMQFTDYDNCVKRWNAALDVPTIQIKFAGFEFNAKAGLVCKRLFPNGEGSGGDTFFMKYSTRPKSAAWGEADKKPKNATNHERDLKGRHICDATQEVLDFAQNPRAVLGLEALDGKEIGGPVLFRKSSNNQDRLCRVGKTWNETWDKLQECSPCASEQ